MKHIAVVIPSYENPTFLGQCLYSIREHLRGIDYEVAVVDNASSRTDVARLLDELERDRKISVIRNGENLGYSRAVNQGITLLNKQSKDIDAYLVLNQDTRLLDDHIHTALNGMDQDPRMGMCGPKLHNGDGSVQNSFYAFPSPAKKIAQLAGMKKFGIFARKTSLFTRLFFFPSFASYYLWNFKTAIQPIEVPWCTGACLLIRKETFEGLSGFDDNIWMYAEDMDFCFRAKEMGWTVVFFPDWHVCHHGGKASDELSEERLEVYYESLSYFYSKHFCGMKKGLMLFLNKLEKAKTVKIRRNADR